MSERDVYDHEMLKQRLSDRDVERVLTGGTPESRELARLGPALEALHAARPGALPEELVARFAAQAAEMALFTAPDLTTKDAPEETASPAERSPRPLRRRVVVLMTATLTFAALTGVAFAADTAAPGDSLYGIDQALEQVGINDGGPAERLAEAQTLAQQGRAAEAMRHIADLVETSEHPEGVEGRSNAADALRDAADRVQDAGDDTSADVRAAVAAMLSEMADISEGPAVDGSAFGVRVSEMARLIAGNGPDDVGPPENAGPNPPPTGNTGPPEGQDVPGDQGQAGDEGGPPADRGQPENPGNSSSGGKP